MQFQTAVIAAMLAGSASSTAQAGEPKPETTFEFSRHYTSNALDGPVARPDWYSTLRGAIENTMEHELGQTRISAEAQLRRYDSYNIENDGALSVAAVTTVKPSDAIELRGTLSLKLASEGGDLIVGPVILGLRTNKAVATSGLQAGFQLAPGTVLILEGGASHEDAGHTRFEDDILSPAQLDPDRQRVQTGATLTRKAGMLTYGGSVSAGYLHSHGTDLYGAFALEEYAARLHASLTAEGNWAIAASGGMHVLRIASADFTETKPVFEVTASKALPAGFTLRGAIKAAYDTSGSDDPLATWVRRMEAEGAYRVNPALQFGIGVFDERRDNIGFATRESERGYYGEAVWQTVSGVEVLLRIDVTEMVERPSGSEQETIDVKLALSRKI